MQFLIALLIGMLFTFLAQWAWGRFYTSRRPERKADFFEPVNWVWNEEKAAGRRAAILYSKQIKADY